MNKKEVIEYNKQLEKEIASLSTKHLRRRYPHKDIVSRRQMIRIITNAEKLAEPNTEEDK